MKRTYPANIDGQIFYIDDDAFVLLKNYLEQLKHTFPGSEGREIVSDIESRIREHFNERISSGSAVIVIEDVERVIETMGRPEDIYDGNSSAGNQAYEGTDNGKSDGNDTSHSGGDAALPPKPDAAPRKLYRDVKNKVFGGVIGGLALYLGWNANVMRLLLVVLTLLLFKYSMFIFLCYLVAWMIIPPALTPKQRLEQHGEPVNIGTVGQSVMADAGTLPPPYKESTNFFSTLMSVIGKCIAGFVGFISGTVSVAFSAAFIGFLVAAVVWGITGSTLMNVANPFMALDGFEPVISLWLFAAGMSVSLFFAVLSLAITWGCVAVIIPVKHPAKSTVISLAVTIAILAILAIVLCIIAV